MPVEVMGGSMAAQELVAQALGLEMTDVPPDATFNTVAEWDSLGHLRIIMALEEKLERRLTPQELFGIDSVTEVGSLIALSARCAP